MPETTEEISKGLEDVNIKWTRLTTIDGNKGILRYGGYSVEDIINNGAQAEEIQYLFLYGELPNAQELKIFKENVQKGYNIPDFVINSIRQLPRESDAVAMQMAAVASMAASEIKFKWNKDTDRDVAAQMIGSMSAITANVYRHILGMPAERPKPSDSYAESFLKAAFGRNVTKEEVDAINTALILYTDHEVPASTTAGLVAVSTLSDIYSGITAALAALKGPLHGGAAEAAIAQFDEIKEPSNVEKWFNDNIINGKKRLMGFGHRVYKTYDPRAKIFKGIAENLSKNNAEVKKIYDIATKLEDLGVKQFGSKGIYPNTDYFSGIVYMSVGFPLRNNIYTALFALSRVTGWEAHFIEYVEEQQRLIRPRAVYVGPAERKFVKLPDRK
ncbi:citrate synthase [Thermoplasma volcanium GSS1]|uniref:Citrate synthase n=1 Tax=Thermoplasma volcanium (strain ATCC 51530 / DSM 4299 / JCM 9571 / NBRC 15438 / GSS1) TaxID=273116 RepID=Q97C64_THEVO|nr:citrate synthase [Thermoplasma volcanium]BAB59383.1 citrate synthase [Thermoplasma volcanium GSS1]